MQMTPPSETVHTLSIVKEIQIAAPVQITFEAVLEELGPGSEMPDGTPFPMKIEPWPGGRWYRDLGNNTGHFWGHVQVIKPPPHPQPLLEICGPMFMSYPAASHVQYRLVPSDGGTLLKITHRAFGLIPAEHREGVAEGWNHGLKRIRELAERRRAGDGREQPR
jgi:uncharacterized protein YndB with AHSA1/START domain